MPVSSKVLVARGHLEAWRGWPTGSHTRATMGESQQPRVNEVRILSDSCEEYGGPVEVEQDRLGA